MTNMPVFTASDKAEVFDVLATAIVIVDADLTIAHANVAAESLLQKSAVKLIGSSIDEIFIRAEEFIAVIKRSLGESRSFTERDLELFAGVRKTVLVDCTVSPWHAFEQGPAKVVVELTSVERHQKIQSEENMLMQNQVTTALMRGLAHEVKNPLGGIRGAAQLLEREFEDQRQAEYTQIIIGEADRLRTLVDRMLGPYGVVEKQQVNIHDVLEHVRQLVSVEYAGRITINCDYDPSLPELSADRDQLIQAFLNLTRNAARATEEVQGTITLRSRIKRKFTIAEKLHRLVIKIDIIDDGPGVPAEIADSIFFPMVSGYASGSGLGLPLAQSMVNRQGGLISFRSEPGATEFSVWLPLEETK